MAGYLVRVQVIGNEYFFSVPTEELAQKHVRQIKKHGYMRFEVNANQYYPSDRIIKVNYERYKERKSDRDKE